MNSSMKTSKILILFFVIFLFADYLRTVTDAMIDRSADNLLYCGIAIMWATYLKRRIPDKRMQKVLIGLAMNLVLLFLIRTCKYVLFEKNTILWYMYYIPLTFMPLMLYLMTKRIGEIQVEDTEKSDKYYIAGFILLNLMILTNDLHQLVFRFTTPGDIDTYTYGIGYVLTIAWIAIFILLGLYNLYRVCRLPQSRGKFWVVITPLLIGIGAIVLDIFHMVPMINDTKIYQFQEVVLVMVIATVEACIYIGLIPSNDGYEEIFENSSINACIVDHKNQVVYSSCEKNMIREDVRLAANIDNVMIDDFTRLHACGINGGMVYFTEDIREIVKLNHMLEEATEVISAEQEMIEAENQMIADEVLYKTKSKLYDDIARIVHPQVLMIEDCLSRCERESEEFCNYMAKAMVLNAYIKRRINLSLIAMEQEQISLTELGLAIAESLTYLTYSDIITNVLNDVKNMMINAKRCIETYDAFEKLIEVYYENMTACMVTIDEKQNLPILRITVETTVGTSLLSKYFEEYEVFEDEDAIGVTISLLEGGGAL